MKFILKITAGILLAVTVLVVGCGVLVAGSVDTPKPTPSNNGAPTTTQADSTDTSNESNEPDLTSGQEQALQSAKSYIDMSGFSRKGLIQQLSSEAGDGFPRKDAIYAADNVGADYKAEAVESAKQYLDMGGFSRDSLFEQLSSSAGDQYTEAQARYAVEKVY